MYTMVANHLILTFRWASSSPFHGTSREEYLMSVSSFDDMILNTQMG